MTSENKISMDKKYRTRDGLEVRLLCVDGLIPHRPVAVYIGTLLVSLTADGKLNSNALKSQYDLIEVVPDVVRWVNVYSDGGTGSWHPSRELADNFALDNHIAILKITTKNGGVNGAEDVSVEVLPVGRP